MSLDRWPPALKEAYRIIEKGDVDLVVCPVCRGSVEHPNRDPSPRTILWLLDHARGCRSPQARLPGT